MISVIKQNAMIIFRGMNNPSALRLERKSRGYHLPILEIASFLSLSKKTSCGKSKKRSGFFS
jgi:hypothetical protein